MPCCIDSRWCWLLLLLLTACKPAADSPATLDLPIWFTADMDGRLEPCGCFTGQYGGMSRLRTVLDAEAGPSALRVDVGDAIAGAADYDVIQYRHQLRAFEGMHYDALNLGHREARLAVGTLRELRKLSAVPLLGANLLDAVTRQSVAEPYRILVRGGFRIAVIGVMDPKGLAERLGDGLVVEPMETTLATLLPKVRPLADLVVLLAFTDEAGMERLAQQFYEVDVILGGKVRQPAQELKKENRSLIYYTTNESRALGLLRLAVTGRSKLSVMHHEIRLLNDKIPQASPVKVLAAAYRAEVRRTRLAIDDPESLRTDQVPGVRASATFAGSESCLACHPDAATKWRDTGHAHAFAALARSDADADPKCILCHTVGFGAASGYRRELGATRLVDVGCESCHGPGSLHVRQRNGDATVDFKFRPLAAGDCQKCHFGEFSRPFDWAVFWPRIAHGPGRGEREGRGK